MADSESGMSRFTSQTFVQKPHFWAAWIFFLDEWIFEPWMPQRLRDEALHLNPSKSPVSPRFKPTVPANYTHQEWLLRRFRPEYARILFLAEGFGFSWPE